MSPIKRILYIFALSAMWSPSFLFIKLAVQEIPPLTTVTLRIFLATLIVSSILAFKKSSLPKDIMFWVHSASMAFLASVLPFYLFCFAEQSIDSALAAILNGSAPMFTAVLSHCFIPSDRLNIQKIIGIFLSAFGLILLFLPNILNGVSGDTIGLMAAATASFCYAVSHVYAKKFLTKQAPFVTPTAQLIMSFIMLLPLSLLIDKPYNLPIPSIKALGGVCGLAVFGTAIAFIIYYKVLEHCGPTAISMAACFFPAGGMLLGYLFLGETLTWASLGASTLILSGIVIVNEIVKLPQKSIPIPQVD